jgi:hypothetical protein
MSAPKAPKIPLPAPPKPVPQFKAGSAEGSSAGNEMQRGKKSLKNESVSLGIPTIDM